jgi:hypothetical protein
VFLTYCILITFLSFQIFQEGSLLTILYKQFQTVMAAYKKINKRKHRPLFAGQVLEIFKKVNKLNTNPSIALFFNSESWLSFVTECYGPEIKEQEFLLGGLDPTKKSAFDDMDNDVMENLINDLSESDAESNNSNPWNFDNGISFNEYFDDDVDEVNYNETLGETIKGETGLEIEFSEE